MKKKVTQIQKKGNEISLTPDKLGFLTEKEALKMGLREKDLLPLDFLRLHGRKHYRIIDVCKALKEGQKNRDSFSFSF